MDLILLLSGLFLFSKGLLTIRTDAFSLFHHKQQGGMWTSDDAILAKKRLKKAILLMLIGVVLMITSMFLKSGSHRISWETLEPSNYFTFKPWFKK